MGGRPFYLSRLSPPPLFPVLLKWSSPLRGTSSRHHTRSEIQFVRFFVPPSHSFPPSLVESLPSFPLVFATDEIFYHNEANIPSWWTVLFQTGPLLTLRGMPPWWTCPRHTRTVICHVYGFKNPPQFPHVPLLVFRIRSPPPLTFPLLRQLKPAPTVTADTKADFLPS